MAAVVAGNGIAQIPCSLPRRLPTSPTTNHPIVQIRNSSSFPSSNNNTRRKTRTSVFFSPNPNQDNGTDTTDPPPFLSPEDLNYLGKLTAGSVGGASVIKYGSILFPEVARPNLLQALLMISLPVLVAVVILIKESSSKSQS